MGVISRGVKNAFRNSIRTISIVFILAVSIGMALVMLMSLKTVQAKITSVKSSIGNIITVSPAGIRGFEGGGEALTTTDVASLSSIPNVTKTVMSISDRMNTDSDTNLKAAVEAGSFGNRQRAKTTESSGDTSNAERPTGDVPTNFSMPITAIGTNDLSVTSNLEVSQFSINSGEKFDASGEEKVALIGTELATKNSLTVGSTFTAYSNEIKVVGIYDGGNKFANANVIMPLKTLQTLSGQDSSVTSVTIQTNSIDSVSAAQSAIEEKLGDKVDVTSQQDSSQEAVKPLENIKTISLYSLIGSLVAGAIIIFLTMVMIVRERRKEIGVLKAIGASNIIVTLQFMVESLSLTLTSAVLGVVAGLALSNPILKVLVNNSETTTSTAATNPGAGGPGRMMAKMGLNSAQNMVSNLHATVGYEILLYGLLAAILIAIIGSVIPSYFIAKIRPAEVMRNDD